MQDKVLGMGKGTAFIVTMIIDLSAAALLLFKERWGLALFFIALSIICFYMALGGWRS